MKKLINKKTGEIAFINLYTNTIYFSNSKTTHKISIQKNPNTNQITKITTFPEPINYPIPEPISEPIINNSTSEPSNTSTTKMESSPITNTPKTNNHESNELHITHTLYSSSKPNKINYQNNTHKNTLNISINNPNLLPSSTPNYKQTA